MITPEEKDRAPKLAPDPTPTLSGTGAHDTRLQEFLLDEMKDIYWAEQHLIKTLPKMREAATSAVLRDAFEKHLAETQQQVVRLEQAFALLGAAPEAKKCEAMAGITEEGDGLIADTEAGTATRDVGLVFAAQKVEHYEIATYGGLVQVARILGRNDVAGLLDANLTEEKGADKTLTLVAEGGINYAAAQEG